jgi:hypothetical protein
VTLHFYLKQDFNQLVCRESIDPVTDNEDGSPHYRRLAFRCSEIQKIAEVLALIMTGGALIY